MWVFPTKQFSNSVQISAVCPTILFSCDTNYLELVQTSLVKGSAPQDCPPTSDSNCKYWIPSYPQFIWLVLKFGIPMTLSSSLIICYDNTWKSGTFLIYSYVYNLESLLDCKEIQPVHSKGDQSWVLFGKIDAKAETPILWPPHAKSWLIGKDSDAGRDWGQEEKGMTEDEVAGWHHRLDGHEFGWTLGIGDGQGGLACCNSWGRKELDMIEQLNWTEHRMR